jgi:FkbM family methyltransferase
MADAGSRSEVLYEIGHRVARSGPARDLYLRLLARSLEGTSHASEVRQFTTGRGHALTIDLADRYARDLYYGINREELEFETFLSLLEPGMEVWDVGANIGFYTVAAASIVGATGRVVAFEPDPHALALLRANVEKASPGRVEILPLALSSSNGSATLFVASDSAFSGLADTGRSPVRERRTVEAETIDRMWDAHGRRPVNALKIDVEGHEAAVIAGGLVMIAGSPELIIQMEANAKNLAQGGAEDFRLTIQRLTEIGFDGLLVDERDELHALLASGSINPLLGQTGGNLFLARAGTTQASAMRASLERIRADAASHARNPDSDAFSLNTLLHASAEELEYVERGKREIEALCREVSERLATAEKAKQEIEALCTKLSERLAAAEKASQEVETLCRTRLGPAEERCREFERQLARTFPERLKRWRARLRDQLNRVTSI